MGEAQRGQSEEVLKADMLGGLKIVRPGAVKPFERVLIYGDPGTGKTPLIASAEQVECFSPILIINVDRGTKSLANLNPNVATIPVRTFQELYNVFRTLHQKKGAGYRSVALDGTTTAQFRGFEQLINDGKVNTDFIDFKIPSTMPEWTASIHQMTILFNAFNELPMHVFMTAWARNVAKPKKMGDTPPPRWVPDFTPGVLNVACGAFDDILYMYYSEGNGQRCLKSKGTATAMSRSRGDRLPDVVPAPTMQLLAKHWGLL